MRACVLRNSNLQCVLLLEHCVLTHKVLREPVLNLMHKVISLFLYLSLSFSLVRTRARTHTHTHFCVSDVTVSGLRAALAWQYSAILMQY